MITSTANPKVKQLVLWQTKAKERRKDNVFIAEGLKMFAEAPVELIQAAYLTEDVEKKLSNEKSDEYIRIWNKLNKVGFEVVSEEVMKKVSDTQTPQGLLTVLSRPHYSMEKILSDPKGLYLLLEDIQDPGNLGTIFRTAEGAGVTGIIATKNTVDIFSPKTIRSTMGSVYRIPFIYEETLQEVICKMREKQIKIYAAHLKGQMYYSSFSFVQGTAFLIGNEGNGLRKETADMADSYIKIPMEGQVESLNAAIATALLIYEAHRQRNIE